ncbi:hypothetical protein Y032_0161g3386 [Ancylostoma ceylanicum]|nr:hypothetical protein Y032_0161g3386 [Ancylostoma ceylanicum]
MVVEAIFITAILWCKAFHTNLRILLTNLTTAYIMITIANTGKFIWKTWDERTPAMFHNFSRTGSVIFLLTFVFILVERVYAIRHSDSYENCDLRFPREVVLLCVLEWCVSFATLFVDMDGHFGVTQMLITAIIVECLCTLVFFFLYRWARRIYSMHVNTSLSNRYQQSENVRTTSSFWTALAYACVSNIVITAGFFVVTRILEQGVPKDVCEFVLITIMISQPMVMITQLWRCNPKLRKLLAVVRPYAIKPLPPLSLKGDPLFLDVSLHRDLYFKSYRECWEADSVKSKCKVLC